MTTTEEKEGLEPMTWEGPAPSTLLFDFVEVGGSIEWTYGRRLGYKDLWLHPRLPSETASNVMQAFSDGFLVPGEARGCNWLLTNKGAEYLTDVCDKKSLNVFVEIVIEYYGLKYNKYEAKPVDLDKYAGPANERVPNTMITNVWAKAEEFGLKEGLKRDLKFSDVALFFHKLPEWAILDRYIGSIGPYSYSNDQRDQEFHRAFRNELKRWFKQES